MVMGQEWMCGTSEVSVEVMQAEMTVVCIWMLTEEDGDT